MASYRNTSKHSGLNIGLRDPKNGVQVEQKAAHVELLLRRLYAKVDELETVCKEEKEFHALLKRKGRKCIPKYDSQLLPRVVASQQRCAETAFNNLDLYKWNLRSSGRRSTVSLPVKDKQSRPADSTSIRSDNQWTSSVTSTTSVKSPEISPVPRDGGSSARDASWYGSLDRNVKRKKRGYLDRSRRHTKTVGSLAGLDVENIDSLQPDEQYTFGLPTVDAPKFESNLPVIETSISAAALLHGVTRSMANSCNGLPDRKDMRINWQLPPSHAYTRSQPVPVFTSTTTERDQSRWLESSVDTVDAPLGSVEISIPPPSDIIAGTDFNFNRLAISSPTQASERSSRSSENGDSKAGFVNESSKPFEMSDYYKYSMKYRGQRKEPMSLPKPEAVKLQRMNGAGNIRPEVSTQHGMSDSTEDRQPYNPDLVPTTIEKDSISDEVESPVPKLPPKLRPLMNGVAGVNNNRLMQKGKPNTSDFVNGNAGDTGQAAWVQTTPTIV